MRTSSDTLIMLFFAVLAAVVQKAFTARVATRTLLDQENGEIETDDYDAVDWDLDPQSQDARKAEFKMPDFDKLARVRPRQLEGKKLLSKVASEACKAWRTGSWSNGSWGAKSGTAEAGIVFDTWDERKLGPKLPAFEKYAHKNGKHPRDGEMDFDEFSRMLKEVSGDNDWAARILDAPEAPNLRKKDEVTNWLKTHFKYNTKYATKIAQLFVKPNRNQEDLVDLANFATLDADKDAVLGIVEAQPYLPIDPNGKTDHLPKYEPYLWDETARVENTDFAGLGFPSHLTNNLLTMTASKHAFEKAEYNRLHLPEKLTDFVERSRSPPFKTQPQESLKEQLRFFQIATALPSTKDPEKRSFKQIINEEEVEIHIPTIEDVAGQKKRLELGVEDVKRWLKHEKGMKNNKWLKWTGLYQYASDMARDVLRWGNGSIPGNDPNTRLQGPRAGEDDEFTDVAPRMALFVALDDDGDGKVDFSAVHPYLKPEDESLYTMDGPVLPRANSLPLSGQNLMGSNSGSRVDASGNNVLVRNSGSMVKSLSGSDVRHEVSHNSGSIGHNSGSIAHNSGSLPDVESLKSLDRIDMSDIDTDLENSRVHNSGELSSSKHNSGSGLHNSGGRLVQSMPSLDRDSSVGTLDHNKAKSFS